MSLVPNPAINDLVQASLESDHYKLRWVPHSEIADIKPTQIDNVYFAIQNYPFDDGSGVHVTRIMLLCLGNIEECTPALVNEFARIYSIPTQKYNTGVNQFRRYKIWLETRNCAIEGFTEYDSNYYMIADLFFYHCYSRYGFCAACGILRCSPVWCICGHKQLSDGWTSNNRQLDELIKKSQIQTNSANDAYLEWIPFACIDEGIRTLFVQDCIPTTWVKLITLEITDETHDLYYAELCDENPDMLATDVWIIIGFTYNAAAQKYYLIKDKCEGELCLACTRELESKIDAFCYRCKAPRPPDWTTGNKSLDLFIMESWNNTEHEDDGYIRWIEYSQLTDVQQMTSLRHGCTHVAYWLEPVTNKWIQVTLKQIGDSQSLDFDQLTRKYPNILTTDNIWIIGITCVPFTQTYCLVFYCEMHAILDGFIQCHQHLKYIQYVDFDELNEIGSGSCRTIYTAKYKGNIIAVPEIVALAYFKSCDQAQELFISEFRKHTKSLGYNFLKIYGVTQNPETKEYVIVMQYANNGSLLSYLDQNINKLTWKIKLGWLYNIAHGLHRIHLNGLVHCDLHGGNILTHDYGYSNYNSNSIGLYICNFACSQSVNSHQQKLTIRGALPFIAPEALCTRKFTQKSDIYSFGIIMYLIATGKPSFNDREFNRSFTCDIMDGLRPAMLDSAPKEYQELAEQCCDIDSDKRPNSGILLDKVYGFLSKINKNNSDSDIWNTIYHNNANPPLSNGTQNFD